MNYTADDLGRFDISITPGETWAFVASYEGHDLCYGGDELDDFPCSHTELTHRSSCTSKASVTMCIMSWRT